MGGKNSLPKHVKLCVPVSGQKPSKDVVLNMINCVDYLQCCRSFSKLLRTSAQFSENQGGGKMLLSRLSPSGSAAATKTPANADRRESVERIHQKQASEQPRGPVVTYTSSRSLKDIQEKSTFLGIFFSHLCHFKRYKRVKNMFR